MGIIKLYMPLFYFFNQLELYINKKNLEQMVLFLTICEQVGLVERGNLDAMCWLRDLMYWEE